MFGGARLAPGPVTCSDIRQVRIQLHGWVPLSPSAPASSWDPAAPWGHDLQRVSRALLSPALLVAGRDLGILSAPWDRACVCALFCSTPSLAQTHKSYSKSPMGTQKILSGWDQLHAHPSHALEEITCKHHGKLVPRAGSQTQSLPGKVWTASVSPLAPSSLHTILVAAEQKGAIASLLLP